MRVLGTWKPAVRICKLIRRDRIASTAFDALPKSAVRCGVPYLRTTRKGEVFGICLYVKVTYESLPAVPLRGLWIEAADCTTEATF